MSLLARLFPRDSVIAALRAQFGDRAETLSRPDGAHPGECIGSPGYRVERHLHGVVIRGTLPVNDLAALVEPWRAEGFDLADVAIAAKLGAALVVTSAEGSRPWREELGL